MASRLMRRLLFGAVFAFIGINFLAALGLFWLTGSVSEYDGEISGLAGLSAPAVIDRDASGTVTIKAETPEDASFALGYAHAQDRLWQMEMMRRLGAGRISEVVGESALGFDKMLRTLSIRRLAEANAKTLSAEARAHLESYAAGVNAYLETRSGPLPPEFIVLGVDPEPWTPADSLVWGRLMSLQLAGNWFGEIARARMYKAGLSVEQIDELFVAFDDDTPVLTAPDLAGLKALSPDMLAGVRAAIPETLQPRRASNAWVLSGDNTPTGKPVLAGDPHLGLQMPNLWWLARLEAPGYLRAGAFVPGVPFLVIGHNGAVAWSFTTTHSDTQDLFVEKIDPTDPTRYLTPDGSAPFETRLETFTVGDEVIEHTVRTTRHGPVVSDAMDKAAQAAADGTVLALASPVLAEDDGTAQALFDLGSAISVDEVMAALRGFHSPQQNILFADTTGRIAMVSAGRVPIRRSGDGFLPSPGWTGTHDWLGWAPFDALPTVIDPEGGAIVNANERVIGAAPDLFLSRQFDAPYRARRIVSQLIASGGTVHEMAEIQMDLTSLFARALLPEMLARLPRVEGDGLESVAAERLSAWNGAMDPDGPEPLIFAAWVRMLHSRLFDDELGPLSEDYGRARAATLLRVLNGEGAWCDDISTPAQEICDEVVGGAYADALALLARLYGNDIEAWRWGEAHRAWFRHQVWSRIPLIGRYLTTRTPTGGGDYTVSRGTFRGPNDDPFRHGHGAGMRVVYDFADLDRSRFVAALGPSGNLLSEFTLTWHEAWGRNEGFALDGQADVEFRLSLAP
jgi:penicillin amidase